jgi:hypothetical protein
MLADAGVAAIAVEPSATMRTVLRSLTRVSVIAAIAEDSLLQTVPSAACALRRRSTIWTSLWHYPTAWSPQAAWP